MHAMAGRRQWQGLDIVWQGTGPLTIPLGFANPLGTAAQEQHNASTMSSYTQLPASIDCLADPPVNLAICRSL